MRRGYGQYCPLALATEVLGQRWTILVISRLLDGCTTFNEIHRGVPRISPSLLSTRLSELEHAGIIKRKKLNGQKGFSYSLTQAGLDLNDIVMQIAVWGQHWARDMCTDDLDPGFLAWSMHTRMNGEAMPRGRLVLQFDFAGAPLDCRRFWLISENGEMEMCLKHPGFETDLWVSGNLRYFIEAWRGLRDLRREIDSGRIKLAGPSELVSAFPNWLLLSGLATYERKRPGRERRIASQTN